MTKCKIRNINDGLRNGEKGVVLILTFIFMISLIIIVAAYLFMVTYGMRNVNAQVNNTKALYLADSGLNKAVWYLTNTAPDSSTDGSWRTTAYPAAPGADATDPQQESLGDGIYTMWVETSGGDILITARGAINNVERVIQQRVIATAADWAAAFSYAIFSNVTGGTLELKDNVTINGHLYNDFSGGTVEVDEDASVTSPSYVYADSVTGDGTYTQAPSAPTPVPTFPSFTTTTYDSAIAMAESSSSGDLTLSGSSNLDLSGGTVYYDKLTVKDDATITGPGTIVTTDKIEFKNDANIGQNVTIITKKEVTIKNSAVVQQGSVIYSRKDIKLKDDADVTGSLIAQVSGKKVKLEGESTFTGIIYSSEVELKDDAIVNGAVVADSYKKDKIEGDVTINYDSDYLPSSVPTGLEGGSITVASVVDTWKEI